MEKEIRKVLITSIGGGKVEDNNGIKALKKYENTTYTIKKENGEYYDEKTSYMPSVIENAYGIDKTIIIGTTGSMWDNIYEQYCIKYNMNIEESFKKSLVETQLNSNKDTSIKDINIEKFNKEFEGKVKGIVIKYGLNKEEIFKNFDLIIKLQEEFNDSDKYAYRVYLDITHSFRSMAFWMFLVMNYLTDISDKNITIAGITYGMFEAKVNREDKTPIVLLEPFSEILNWIKGASELKQYGNSYSILNNLRSNNIDEDIVIELENFSNAMNMNYVGSLLKSIDKLKNLEDKIDFISGPAKHIIPDILKNFIKDFDLKEDNSLKRSYLLQGVLAKWHFSQKRYAMAAININEAILLFIISTLDIDSKIKKGKYDPNNDGQKWLTKIYNTFKKLENLDDRNKKLYEYAEMYVETKRIRNDIAHSIGKENNILEDIERLRNYLDRTAELLNDESFIKESENNLNFLKKPQVFEESKKATGKSIILLSVKILSNKEKQELKEKWKIENIIDLTGKQRKLWKETNEKKLTFFKKLIVDKLKVEDYVLVDGELKKIHSIGNYATSKKIKVLYLSDDFQANKGFFKEF